MNGKVLLLNFTLDTLNPCGLSCPGSKDVVLNELLGDGTCTLIKVETGCDAIDSGTDDTVKVNTIVGVKTSILNGYKSLLQMLWHIIDGDVLTVGTGSYQSSRFGTIAGQYSCRVSGRDDIVLGHVRRGINDSLVDAKSG